MKRQTRVQTEKRFLKFRESVSCERVWKRSNFHRHSKMCSLSKVKFQVKFQR